MWENLWGLIWYKKLVSFLDIHPTTPVIIMRIYLVLNEKTLVASWLCSKGIL
jgi:hypothetical protein